MRLEIELLFEPFGLFKSITGVVPLLLVGILVTGGLSAGSGVVK